MNLSDVCLILLSQYGGNISTKVGVIILFPEHMFSNNEILLCDAIQSEFKVNAMNSIAHNTAGCKLGAAMLTIKHDVQKNELTLYISTVKSRVINNVLAGGLGVDDNRMTSAKFDLIYLIFLMWVWTKEKFC